MGATARRKRELGLSGRFGDSETRSRVSDRDIVRVGEGRESLRVGLFEVL